ncbi:restriction modification system DNA specificity domain protein (plasmid) [Shewanella baltica OS223]|uniref:restriction endonuclease subunit S n=1 Tax=Shewanella baltica TaxID=62322 RepID=UPI00015307C8|nr:restriction endonuclease subunit S [Shewanella baltica]ACK48908.1 restriction modification system DNA specificity domain protein [Shewanella baltica OS223]
MEQVLYSLPEGWHLETIGEVASKLVTGKTPSTKKAEYYSSSEVDWFTPSDFGSTAVLNNSRRKLSSLAIEDGTIKKMPKDSILLVAIGATIGKVGLAEDESCFNQQVTGIHFKEKIHPKYAYYWLSYIKPEIITKSSQATLPIINQTGIKGLSFLYPEKEEQKCIVEKLDALLTRIDTAIEHLQESITLKNSLLQSALDGQFSAITERMTIESLAEVKGGKRLPKGEKLSDEETEHPYIRVADFTDKGTIDLSGIKYISKEIHEQIKRYVISKDDLYISIAGTIGKTGFVPSELDGANLTENAAKLVIKDKQQLDLSYLYLFTLTSDFSAQAGLATKTVAQPKLALTRLSKIEIPICSLEEQKSLVSTIEALKSKIHDAEAVLLGKIEDLKSLKASILDSAFKGEL